MLSTWYFQLLLLLLIGICLQWFKRRWHFWPKHLLVSDLICPFLLIPISSLSQLTLQFSVSLYLIFILSLLGLVMTINQIFFKGDIIFKKFMRQYWLLLDGIIYLALISIFVVWVSQLF